MIPTARRVPITIPTILPVLQEEMTYNERDEVIYKNVTHKNQDRILNNTGLE